MASSKKPVVSGKKRRGGYAVGYGKPPLHTRFRKGQSGNPLGRAVESRRAKASPVRRAKALALAEAYRTVTVANRAGGMAMPAIQAVMRRQIALAIKGNGPAQRAVIAAVAGIEEEEASAAAEQSARETQTGGAYAEMSDTEAARRIAFLLRLTAEQDPEFRAELAPDVRGGIAAVMGGPRSRRSARQASAVNAIAQQHRAAKIRCPREAGNFGNALI